MLKALQKRAKAVMHWSGGWIAPKACCPGIAAHIIRRGLDVLLHPCLAPTPQWGGRHDTAAGCRPSNVACRLPQRAQVAYLSAQTRPKNSHRTEALLKVASVCVALQHFWRKLIVSLLHRDGWRPKIRLSRIQHPPPWMHPLQLPAASAAVNFASKPGSLCCRAAAAQARVCRCAGAAQSGS